VPRIIIVQKSNSQNREVLSKAHWPLLHSVLVPIFSSSTHVCLHTLLCSRGIKRSCFLLTNHRNELHKWMGPASTTMTIGGTWSQRRNTFKYCVLVGIKTSKTKPWLLRDRDYSQIKIPCWDSSELITWFQLNQHIRNWEMTNINANLLCSTLHKNNQWVPRQNKSLICTKHRKLELELISDLQDDKTELLYWINEYQGRTSPDLQ
jgi:hypothetical protein